MNYGFHLLTAFLITMLFFSGCTTKTQIQTENDALKTKCCGECTAAFSQSPVGVGSAGAKCGYFMTAQPLSEECSDYFKNKTTMVTECQ